MSTLPVIQRDLAQALMIARDFHDDPVNGEGSREYTRGQAELILSLFLDTEDEVTKNDIIAFISRYKDHLTLPVTLNVTDLRVVASGS